MDLGLSGKTVLVAGSTRGIGHAIVTAFLAEGARVVLTGRDAEAVRSCVAELEESHPSQVMGWSGDLTQMGDIDECLAHVARGGYELDILVAAVGGGAGPRGWDVEGDEWTRMFELNLFGSMRLVRRALRGFVARRSGAVTLISSIAGCESLQAPVHYTASKAAVIAAAKGLAREVARDNVRVNTVAPGNVWTEGGVWDRRRHEDQKSVDAYVSREVPQGRLGLAEEIAAAVVFLCSPKAAFITGSCLVIDGGQTRGW